MSVETNKQLVIKHFEEFVNQKNLAVADRNFAPEYKEHRSDVPDGLPPGLRDPSDT
jgi:predicted SnoaL-like aldol condensation-catalyzing enzyme